MPLIDWIKQITSSFSIEALPDLGAWSYVILMLLVFVEGPVVTLVAATMASAGILRADLVFFFSMLGNFLADAFWYTLGFLAVRYSGILNHRWVQQRWAQIEQVQEAMHGRAARMYLLTKVSLGLLTIPVLIASGLSRVPWYRLLIISIIVEPIWNGLLVLAGYRLGDYVAHLERGLRNAAIVGAVALLIGFMFAYRRVIARLVKIVATDPIDPIDPV
jgi:membrane protein DedA with SNARE-associated domain